MALFVPSRVFVNNNILSSYRCCNTLLYHLDSAYDARTKKVGLWLTCPSLDEYRTLEQIYSGYIGHLQGP